MENDGGDARLGEWLQSELSRRGWDQTALAKRAGVSTGTISNLMTRRKKAHQDTVLKIAEALEVDYWEVAALAGFQVPPPVHRMPGSVNAVAQRLNNLPPAQREAAVYLINQLLTGLDVYDAAMRHQNIEALAESDPELAASAITLWQSKLPRNSK